MDLKHFFVEADVKSSADVNIKTSKKGRCMSLYPIS